MTHFILNSLYELEININRNIQQQLEFAEPLLRTLNIYLGPSLILDLWIPLVGGFSHKLLIQLVSSLSVINVLASVIKWCSPEYRPMWWIKEMNETYNFQDIKSDPYSCDTSAGFLSTHAVTFTAFVFILIWRLVKTYLGEFDVVPFDKFLITHASAFILSTLLWFSRLYFLYEFLHQCIIGSIFAVGLLHIFDYFSKALMDLSKLKAVVVVVIMAIIPINAYFTMLLNDIDPFWSVRMAFKWCGDPLYLKHESTPVFSLCRDFGYMLGVALSCPLAKNYNIPSHSWRKRLPILLVMEFSNGVIRSFTPKQYGRFVFVAYELFRNCLHTFTLLTILPKFGGNYSDKTK